MIWANNNNYFVAYLTADLLRQLTKPEETVLREIFQKIYMFPYAE